MSGLHDINTGHSCGRIKWLHFQVAYIEIVYLPLLSSIRQQTIGSIGGQYRLAKVCWRCCIRLSRRVRKGGQDPRPDLQCRTTEMHYKCRIASNTNSNVNITTLALQGLSLYLRKYK